MLLAPARPQPKPSQLESPCDLSTQREDDPESGLMHYRARSYDQRVGRFIGKDPAHSEPNGYAYVSGDPISKVDPRGLWEIKRDSLASWALARPQRGDTLESLAATVDLDPNQFTGWLRVVLPWEADTLYKEGGVKYFGPQAHRKVDSSQRANVGKDLALAYLVPNRIISISTLDEFGSSTRWYLNRRGILNPTYGQQYGDFKVDAYDYKGTAANGKAFLTTIRQHSDDGSLYGVITSTHGNLQLGGVTWTDFLTKERGGQLSYQVARLWIVGCSSHNAGWKMAVNKAYGKAYGVVGTCRPTASQYQLSEILN